MHSQPETRTVLDKWLDDAVGEVLYEALACSEEESPSDEYLIALLRPPLVALMKQARDEGWLDD